MPKNKSPVLQFWNVHFWRETDTKLRLKAAGDLRRRETTWQIEIRKSLIWIANTASRLYHDFHLTLPTGYYLLNPLVKMMGASSWFLSMDFLSQTREWNRQWSAPAVKPYFKFSGTGFEYSSTQGCSSLCSFKLQPYWGTQMKEICLLIQNKLQKLKALFVICRFEIVVRILNLYWKGRRGAIASYFSRDLVNRLPKLFPFLLSWFLTSFRGFLLLPKLVSANLSNLSTSSRPQTRLRGHAIRFFDERSTSNRPPLVWRLERENWFVERRF